MIYHISKLTRNKCSDNHCNGHVPMSWIEKIELVLNGRTPVQKLHINANFKNHILKLTWATTNGTPNAINFLFRWTNCSSAVKLGLELPRNDSTSWDPPANSWPIISTYLVELKNTTFQEVLSEPLCRSSTHFQYRSLRIAVHWGQLNLDSV